MLQVQPHKCTDLCPGNRVVLLLFLQWKLEVSPYKVLYLSLQDCYSQLSCCCFFDIGHAFGIHFDYMLTLPFQRRSAPISPIYLDRYHSEVYVDRRCFLENFILYICSLFSCPSCAFSCIIGSWVRGCVHSPEGRGRRCISMVQKREWGSILLS